ncbi:Hypothetical predicted protein [Pelobates cultripes]|uniref:RH1 domain-containing protein n=1 Tax=Pelobates cultripes TaxID=61616 RepID=A0AAD1TA33_PELCU|nr:Hypothetical predicted protein [Pelobates cultripes]
MDTSAEEIFGDELGSTSTLAVCDEMVTAMAESIYSELEKLIDSYGHSAVTGLMPLLVSVLESLETTCAQAKESEEQLELVHEDKQRLFIQYERERDARKRAEEVLKCLM